MRKTKVLTITDEGRDAGKTFVLTEMPAYQGIKWADKVLLAALSAGVEIPENAMGSGMVGVVSSIIAAGLLGIGRVPYATIEPLFEELLACAQFQAPSGVTTPIFAGNACQIEEIRTYWTLRVALFELHVGFPVGGSHPATAA